MTHSCASQGVWRLLHPAVSAFSTFCFTFIYSFIPQILVRNPRYAGPWVTKTDLKGEGLKMGCHPPIPTAPCQSLSEDGARGVGASLQVPRAHLPLSWGHREGLMQEKFLRLIDLEVAPARMWDEEGVV